MHLKRICVLVYGLLSCMELTMYIVVGIFEYTDRAVYTITGNMWVGIEDWRTMPNCVCVFVLFDEIFFQHIYLFFIVYRLHFAQLHCDDPLLNLNAYKSYYFPIEIMQIWNISDYNINLKEWNGFKAYHHKRNTRKPHRAAAARYQPKETNTNSAETVVADNRITVDLIQRIHGETW